MRAEAVAMDQFSSDQISYCRKADVWMWPNIYSLAWRQCQGTHMIQENEWADEAECSRRQNSPNFKAADISAPSIDDCRDSASPHKGLLCQFDIH